MKPMKLRTVSIVMPVELLHRLDAAAARQTIETGAVCRRSMFARDILTAALSDLAQLPISEALAVLSVRASVAERIAPAAAASGVIRKGR